MKILILIMINLRYALLNHFIFDSSTELDVIDNNSTKGYIFETDNMQCLSAVNTSVYNFDLWYDDSQYEADVDPHFICCNEPFSPDTIIPSLAQTHLSYLTILLEDYEILTSGKTNCSLYYGHWVFGDISVHADIEPSKKLGIHPLTLRTIIG